MVCGPCLSLRPTTHLVIVRGAGCGASNAQLGYIFELAISPAPLVAVFSNLRGFPLLSRDLRCLNLANFPRQPRSFYRLQSIAVETELSPMTRNNTLNSDRQHQMGQALWQSSRYRIFSPEPKDNRPILPSHATDKRWMSRIEMRSFPCSIIL